MNLKETLQKQFGKRSLKLGTLTILSAALVLAIAIVLNVIFSVLPVTYTEFDLTDSRLYTLTSTTETMVKNLKSEIYIYVICETGEEDSLLRDTLNRYRALSSYIKVEYIDPILNPGFVASVTQGEYTALMQTLDDGETQASANNSLIIKSAKRHQVIYYNDLGYTEYSAEELMNAVLTGTTMTGTSYYNAENMITAGIDYVLTEDIPVYYAISGHEEDSFSTAFLSNVGLSNIEVKKLDLLTVSALPEDADGLMIYNPKMDYNEDEINMVRAFLKQGGDLLLFTRYDQLKNLPKLLALLKEYGVQADSHWIIESSDSYRLNQNQYMVIPEYSSQVFVNDGRVIMGYAHYLEISEELPEGVTAVPILTSQSSAKLQSSVQSADGYKIMDEKGSYPMAVAVEAQNQNAPAAKIVWFPTEHMVSDAIYSSSGLNTNALSSGMNYRYVLSTLTWMSGKDTTVAIEAIKLGTGILSVSERVGVTWAIFLIGVIPAGIGIGGFLYYKKRRAR